MPKTFSKALILTVTLLVIPYALVLFLTPTKYSLQSPDRNRTLTLYDTEGDLADDAWWEVELKEEGKPVRELGHCSLPRLYKYRLIKWLDNKTVLVGIQFENEAEITPKLRIEAKSIPCL